MSTHPHATLIRRFYDAFAARDAATMGACYHDEIVFSDPAFPHLVGAEARGMWAMLVARGKDLRVEASARHTESRRSVNVFTAPSGVVSAV